MSSSGEGRTLHKRTHRLVDFGGRGPKKARRTEGKKGIETEEKIKAIYQCGVRELGVQDDSLPVHAKWCFERKTGYTRCLCLSKFIFDYVDVNKLEEDLKGSLLGKSREWQKWKKIRPPIKLVRRKAIEEIADDLLILSNVRDDLICLDPKEDAMLRRFFEHFTLEVKSSKEMYFRLNHSSMGRVFCWQGVRVLLNCLKDPRGKEEGFVEKIWNKWMARGRDVDCGPFRRYGKKVYICSQVWTLYMKEWQKCVEVGGRLCAWVDEVPRMSDDVFRAYREDGGSVGNMNTLKSHYAVHVNKLVKKYRNVLVADHGWTGGSGVVYETRGMSVKSSKKEGVVRHKNNIRCTPMVSEIAEKLHALAWIQQLGCREGPGSMESSAHWFDPRKLKGADPIKKHTVDTFEGLLMRGICLMVAEGGGLDELEVEDLFTVDCRIRPVLSCFTTEKRGVDMFHLLFSDDQILWAAEQGNFLFCCYVPVDKCGMWLRIKPWSRVSDDATLAETLELIRINDRFKRRLTDPVSLTDYDGMWLYVPYGMAVLLPSSVYQVSDLCTALQGNRYLQVLVCARRNTERTERGFWADVDSDSRDVGRKNFLSDPHYISVDASDSTEAREWCTENLKDFTQCMLF